MSNQEQKNFTFTSGAYPEETFLVARFTGIEGVSQLYEYDITLAAEDPEIDCRAMLQNPATLTTLVSDTEIPVHGMLARFEQLREVDETVFYRAVLVPRLWQTSLYQENQLFLDKSVPDIIEEVLSQAGLTSNDYELRLTVDYQPWEYICQFRETDFDFISRWMEREGIYYFFEQADGSDKLIITDNQTAHRDVPDGNEVPYLPPSGQVPTEEECVYSFTCRHRMLPRKVLLRDYNYRRPTLDLKGEADVDPEAGRGTVYIYGEHFKTPEAGAALAAVRAEEFLCRERVFYGESTAAHLRPGFLFELIDHYRDSYNQRYLITEIRHEGRAARFLFDGVQPSDGGDEGRMGYSNRFVLIPAEVQFRPERKSVKPRFYGSMNATIDAAGDGTYAEVDEEGRYKVILPFDQSGNTEGKASRWIRMAQPHSGPGYGMHLPLHKGAEVLLTFIDGDPDRPIISAAVPNPDTASPVTSQNQTQHILRSRYGHLFVMDDDSSSTAIRIATNGGCTIVLEDQGPSVTLCTPGGYCIKLSDEEEIIHAYTPNGRFLTLDDASQEARLNSQSGHYLSLHDPSGSVKLETTDGHFLEMKPDSAHLRSSGGREVKLDDGASRIQVTDGTNSLHMDPQAIHAWRGSSHLSIEDGSAHMYHESDFHVLVDGGQVKLYSGGAGVRVTDSEVSITAGGSNITVSGSSIDVTSSTVNLNS
jgi:type VI secretion system secreted protein VgrG